jgi:large subunit ribosomal protein L31
MKKETHPKVQFVEVTCTTCNSKFETKTTLDNIKVDVCAKCHPFYTGDQSSNRAAGRIEKFNKKYNRK